MNYEVQRRAELSKRHLPKRFGGQLTQWGAARRSAWRIDDSWSVDRFRRLIEQLRSDYSWQVLTGSKDVVALDKWMQRYLACLRPRPIFRDPRITFEPPPHLTIDEIERKFRAEQPGITRARLRTLLHRSARNGNLYRVAHGKYEHADKYHWSRYPDRSWLYRNDDKYEEWRKRSEQREDCRRLVLATHYVLPLPAARKARQFGISERRYFYDLNDALTRLLPEKEAERF
jgi:hypothetical protein